MQHNRLQLGHLLIALTFVTVLITPAIVLATASSTTYSAPGNYVFTVPTGVSQITVEAWGGGGTGGPATGNGSAGGGGAGGCYVTGILDVTAGNTYAVTVAATSTALTSTLVNGATSTFATTTFVAKGGTGGAIASVATSTGGAGSTSGCVAKSTPVDSYSESNYDNDQPEGTSFQKGYAQTFVGNGSTLGTAKFYMYNQLATGTTTAKIYAITGTPGTNAVPTGAPLATSTDVTISTIPQNVGAVALVTYTFSGANQITLTNGTNYALAVQYAGDGTANDIIIGADFSSPTAAGNFASYNGATWTADNTADLVFYVFDTTHTSTIYAGGSGATSTASTASGGGGGGAGSTGAGGNAGSPFATSSGAGTSIGGGNGGIGTTTSAGLQPGFAFGGGGGGGRAGNATDRAGGNGAGGQVKISYTIANAVNSTKAILSKLTTLLRNATLLIR
jgi:hypothetical protein